MVLALPLALRSLGFRLWRVLSFGLRGAARLARKIIINQHGTPNATYENYCHVEWAYARSHTMRLPPTALIPNPKP